MAVPHVFDLQIMLSSLLLRRLHLAACACVLVVCGDLAWPSCAAANELRIGIAAEVTSIDPHYLNIAPNNAFATHVFDTLVNVDSNGKLIPGLAVSWRTIDPLTWEFKLRKGVKFHDGSDFTADDVVFSFDRPATIPNSPGPFTGFTRQIVSKQVVDPYTVRFRTATPYGPMPLDVNGIFIVSHKAARAASAEDFNSGKAMIGTGPFKFVSFHRGDRIELSRNDAYWGEKSAWDKVVLRMLPTAAPRTAALLAGDVDAIEVVPTADVARLRDTPTMRLEHRTSWRTIFLQLNQQAQASPDTLDHQGKALAKNPLADARVRQAISMAINRQALVSRTLDGLGTPARNLVAPGIVGYNDEGSAPAADIDTARKLLADAGYADGFQLTLHGPANRYPNDEKVLQALGQMLTRIGIKTRIETLPPSVYFGKAKSGEFAISLLGWGTLAGDFALRTLLGTPNADTGWGTWNWGRYSNKELDRTIEQALASVDEKERESLARKGMSIAMHDWAAIPLYHQSATWAMKKNIRFQARIDEFTLAQQFKPE